MWDDRSFLHLKKAQESKGRGEKRNPSYLEKKCIILQFSSQERSGHQKKVPNDKLVLPKTRSETKSLNICNFFCQTNVLCSSVKNKTQGCRIIKLVTVSLFNWATFCGWWKMEMEMTERLNMTGILRYTNSGVA